MDSRKRWTVFRGKLLVLVGVIALAVAIFLPDKISSQLMPLVVLFGVGFIAMAIPRRVWRQLPSWFSKDDSWM